MTDIKDYCIKTLNRIKARHEKIMQIYKLGIDLIEFDEGLTNLLEEGCAMMLSNDEQTYEWALSNIQWWLWEDVEKIIYYPGEQIEVDVTKAEDFVQWMIDNYQTENHD